MPKLVDSYVMTRVIGSGQFGQVLKGYDRTTNNDIAVKVIKRDKIKGKFAELLESQIKVLKTCDNPNIIKLYDIKKTPNNFYIILQYCNEGDLQQYLKKRKFLTEDEALQFLIQILHGFKTLVQFKIMHRDFKLPNVLLHNGEVKIADFGFAKLLGQSESTKTVLGSPLNMAPEVIRGQQYTQKVDIYSIGVCFYQMLFGKPPFNAANIQELVKVIQKGEINFPRSINKISKKTQQLIRMMLIANPAKRIDWPQLFKHPALHQKQQEAADLLKTTLGNGGNLMSNMSKFYIKSNLVIMHPAQITKKQQINDFAYNIFKTNKNTVQFKGQVRKRNDKRKQQVNKKIRDKIKQGEDQTLDEKQSKQEIKERIMRINTNILLNERNQYVFIITILQQLDQIDNIKNSRDLQYLMAVELLRKIEQFSNNINNKKNQFKLDQWESYLQCPAFKLLSKFFQKQQQILRYACKEVIQNGKKSNYSIKQLIKSVSEECITLIKKAHKSQDDEASRIHWIRVDHLLDYPNLQSIMEQQDFNFKLYYLQNGRVELPELINKVIKKSAKL